MAGAKSGQYNGAVTEAESKPMKAAVILAGQSNMAGHGERDELDSAALPVDVRLFDLNPMRNSFGPEIGFARAWMRQRPSDELWLVKYAVGGSSLLAWQPEWTAENAARTDDEAKGALYARLLKHTEQVTRDADCHCAGCLWMQGESDARYAHAAAAYENNLRHFIWRLRRDLGVPRLPFVLGLVNPPCDPWRHVATVREAQHKIAREDDRAALVDTVGLSKHDDNLHYDTAGQLQLGRRFAEALLALQ